MANIIVLGAGMVGSVMAADLSENHRITLADLNLKALEKVKSKVDSLQILQLDITQKQLLMDAVKPFDLVVCGVPGFLGFETLKTLIEVGKDVVDISFFPENALELNQFAVENNVTAIVDCGVAPGMGNMILGYHNEQMQITDFECLVGGLPKVKKWPFCYKAPFSPIDVIEEYTRPARYIENGNIITKPALSDSEFIEFEYIGTLEAFNTDGLRSLIYTMSHIPNMKEKTLRYPGHIEYIKALRAAGFFETHPLDFDGLKISPREFSSKILFNDWKLEPEEAEFTVMRISLKGKNPNEENIRIDYDLYDEYNPKTRTSSMARTTGYTATAAVHLILDGKFKQKGVFPPELVGKHPECFVAVMKYLEERGVNYHKSVFTG